MNDNRKQDGADNGVGSTGGSSGDAWPLPPRIDKLDGATVRTFDPPHTKDIEFCENRGCAFNANTGKCSSTSGQCYGYFPPNNVI